MDELIKVSYDNSERPTVSGRELHEALGIKTAYKDWFPRMCEYGFNEGVDFNPLIFEQVRFEGNREVTRAVTDHQITIAMAKELRMLQRSEIGRRFRQYFISIEEAWNTPEKVMERALTIAHARAIEAEKRILSLTSENEELAIALNTSLEYWTVMKYKSENHLSWNMQQCQSIGRLMTAFCRRHGYEIKKCLTNDDRFSYVNSYPLTAWKAFWEVHHERP